MQSDDERFEACESKLAFLEETIAQLNDALVKQQARIDYLEASLRSLTERMDENSSLPDITSTDERPPHY